MSGLLIFSFVLGRFTGRKLKCEGLTPRTQQGQPKPLHAFEGAATEHGLARGWQLCEVGSCPTTSFDFDHFLSWSDKNVLSREWVSLICEYYFPARPHFFARNPRHLVWKYLLGSKPMIPFDRGERVRQFGKIVPYLRQGTGVIPPVQAPPMIIDYLAKFFVEAKGLADHRRKP